MLVLACLVDNASTIIGCKITLSQSLAAAALQLICVHSEGQSSAKYYGRITQKSTGGERNNALCASYDVHKTSYRYT